MLNPTELDVQRLWTLVDMLRYMRPMGSPTETRFCEDYLYGLEGVTEDEHGNIHVLVPLEDGSPSCVLWSSHTDTVHRFEGYQDVQVSNRTIELTPTSVAAGSNCLGADDTVGVWLMREMILAKVPGHYVFHYGEEKGGVGSSRIVRDQPQLFADAKCAIAFDRRGKRDIITHQAWQRCCSDTFAKSLGKQLRSAGRYRPSDGGIYTDTAEYTSIIGECTNISVGYHDEHRATEHVEYWHALRLLHTLLEFDESKLKFERVPGQQDEEEEYEWVDWVHYTPSRLEQALREEEDARMDAGLRWYERREDVAWRLGYKEHELSEDDWRTIKELGLGNVRVH